MAQIARLVLLIPLCGFSIAAPTAQAQPALPAPPVPPVGVPGNELLLGQHAQPSSPGAAPAIPPNLSAFNNQYLLPQHLVPSAPGEGTLFGVAPGDENADVRAIDYMRRLWEMHQAGGLEGGLLGQRPVETLNQPNPAAGPPTPGA